MLMNARVIIIARTYVRIQTDLISAVVAKVLNLGLQLMISAEYQHSNPNRRLQLTVLTLTNVLLAFIHANKRARILLDHSGAHAIPDFSMIINP